MPDNIPAGIGRQLAGLFRNEADRAMRELAEAVLERSRQDAPPAPPASEDPNPSVSLRESGHVVKVRDGVYDIVFDAPYAAKQHENHRLEHPRGGGPKYLEKNVLQAARDMEGQLAGAVRAVTKRRGANRIDTRRI